jgi:hypothetical protein
VSPLTQRRADTDQRFLLHLIICFICGIAWSPGVCFQVVSFGFKTIPHTFRACTHILSLRCGRSPPPNNLGAGDEAGVSFFPHCLCEYGLWGCVDGRVMARTWGEIDQRDMKRVTAEGDERKSLSGELVLVAAAIPELSLLVLGRFDERVYQQYQQNHIMYGYTLHCDVMYCLPSMLSLSTHQTPHFTAYSLPALSSFSPSPHSTPSPPAHLDSHPPPTLPRALYAPAIPIFR